MLTPGSHEWCEIEAVKMLREYRDTNLESSGLSKWRLYYDYLQSLIFDEELISQIEKRLILKIRGLIKRKLSKDRYFKNIL